MDGEKYPAFVFSETCRLVRDRKAPGEIHSRAANRTARPGAVGEPPAGVIGYNKAFAPLGGSEQRWYREQLSPSAGELKSPAEGDFSFPRFQNRNDSGRYGGIIHGATTRRSNQLLFQGCYNPAYEEQIRIAKEQCFRYNQLSPNDRAAQQDILRNLLGSMGKGAVSTPPFWCDYGYNIRIGDNFYSNHGMVITDGAAVTFGDSVFVAPHCCFTTAEHAIDPEMRKAGIEIAQPITIGNNVWIGANATLLAGVTIGDNTVIGAGSVVTRSIPGNVVAVGVPCRVLRPITDADKRTYPMYTPD